MGKKGTGKRKEVRKERRKEDKKSMPACCHS